MLKLGKRLLPKVGKGKGLPLFLCRIVVCAFAVLLGFFLVEFPFNQSFVMTLTLPFALWNIAVLGLVFLTLYFAGQQSRVMVALFWLACLLVGCANHYLMNFRGTPLIPSDLFALGTAAEVSGGYSLTPDVPVVVGCAVFCAAVVLLALFGGKVRLRRRTALVNGVVALALAGTCVGLFLAVPAQECTGVAIQAFHIDRSCKSEGTALVYVAMGQQMMVSEPDGYSDEAAQALVDEAAEAYDERVGESASADDGTTAGTSNGDSADSSAASGSASGSITTTKKPSVIAIMNETFADLTIFEELKDCEEAYPSNFYQICSESVLSGYSYVPGYGAGTCNSEFEFLTGATMAFCGVGSYPYEYYNLNSSLNLARYFNDLGYTTSAVHPSSASNWNRSLVYPALGFSNFYSESSFEGAQLLRGKTTDKETYKKCLELLDESDSPQFVFDVTYQNHGGYEERLVSEEDYVHADIGGLEYEPLNEYLSCIKRSDEDIKWLIDELKKRDEPVVVVFFGDHTPSITDKVCNVNTSNSSLNVTKQNEKRFTTPYFIWTNFETSTPEIATNAVAEKSCVATTVGNSIAPRKNGCANQANLSLNYLSTALKEAAGLPLDNYAKFLAQLRLKLPLVNTVGYTDAYMEWHRSAEDPEGALAQAFADYRTVQYWALFAQH